MDNVAFHKTAKTRELIEKVDCHLLYLLPYSPDLNPIERFWFAIKYAVRNALPPFWPDINAAIDFIFQESEKPSLGWLYYSI